MSSEPEFRYCPECGVQQPVEDEFDTDRGDEDPTPVRVVALECGHDLSWPLPRSWGALA
jgi:hypothetical protein